MKRARLLRRRKPLRRISAKRAERLAAEMKARTVERVGAVLRAPLELVTTARPPGAALPKLRPLRSPAMLAWVKRQPCAFCGEKGGDPHHIPSRGSLGVAIDVLCVGSCRRCHVDAHAGKIPPERQTQAVGETLIQLFGRAENRETAERVIREIGADL